MYRQILLHEDDQIYQRILWRQNDQIKTFQLNTLTFGVSSSAYLAIRTVLKLADDERDAYSDAEFSKRIYTWMTYLQVRIPLVKLARYGMT